MNLETKKIGQQKQTKKKNVNEGMFSWVCAGFSPCNVM
jgi:hypothetical protein